MSSGKIMYTLLQNHKMAKGYKKIVLNIHKTYTIFTRILKLLAHKLHLSVLLHYCMLTYSVKLRDTC